MSPALGVHGVHAGYGGAPVLRGVDLEVPAGALVAVLGRSGCGKTTLLRAVAGFHPIDAGAVHLEGRQVAGDGVHIAAERRGVGLVPQDAALFGHLTVAGNVGFGLDRRARRGHRVAEVLELVGLPGYERRRPHELSGGQQQRVALGRALAPAPALVLLDEPFTALDTGLRVEVRTQVRAVLRAAGAAAVLVTHDQQEALGIADLVAVLYDGRIVQIGTPQQLYEEPADLDVGTFLGDAVVLPATARAGRASTALGSVPIRRGDGQGHVLLRPEQLRLGPPDAALTGTVRETVFHGHATTVVLDVAGTLVRCRTRLQGPLAVGQQRGIAVSGTGCFYPAVGPARTA